MNADFTKPNSRQAAITILSQPIKPFSFLYLANAPGCNSKQVLEMANTGGKKKRTGGESKVKNHAFCSSKGTQRSWVVHGYYCD